MVKFNMKKMLAAGLLSATAVFAGMAALHGAPSVVAYAEDPTPTPGASSGPVDTVTRGDASYLMYDTDKVTGNYIYVSYYTDEACAKLKSTTVYYKTEVNGNIPLGSLNLKKGGFFKVYDETMTPADVNAYEVDAQAAKVKVKVVDASKENFFEAIEVTVGTTKLTSANWGDYAISMYAEGAGNTGSIEGSTAAEIEESANNFWKNIKVAARANGLTVMVSCGEMKDVEGSKVPSNGMRTEAKFKVTAAPKAPKVTIDYVNGTYGIPKGVKYVVTTVTDGVAAIPTADQLKDLALTSAKESLSVNALVEKAGENAEAAALVVWSEKAKKLDSVQAVYAVKKLEDLTATYADSDTAKEKATVKLGDKEVAVLTFTSTGVMIEAKADIAYQDGQKWVTLKATKSTKKEIAVAKDAKINIKALGTKASKTVEGAFGSAETGIANEYVAPTPSATPTPTPTAGA